MPRLATTIAFDMTSDATWRTMWAAIENAILAMGWVKTSDTGQVDVTTVTRPTGSNQIKGIGLYRANDSLAGTNPMIFRLQLGSAGGATTVRINWQVGVATDGAGNFTARSWSRGDFDFITSSATAWECYFQGDTNSIAMALADNHASTSNLFYGSLERTHNADGTDSNFGIWSMGSRGQTENRHRCVAYAGTLAGEQTLMLGPQPQSGTLIGTDVGLFGTYPLHVVALNPSKLWLHYVQGEIGTNAIISVDMYGATHSFLTTRSARGNRDSGALAMRWDT